MDEQVTEAKEQEYDLDNLPPGIRLLKSGVLYDEAKGRFIKRVQPNPYAITKQNYHEFHTARKEKTARLLRQAIVSETGDLLQVPTKGSAAAVAAAGGILWREIVLNGDAYPRDRMEAWEKLGKHAGDLGDAKEQEADPGAGAAELVGATSQLIHAIHALLTGDKPAAGEVVDAEPE